MCLCLLGSTTYMALKFVELTPLEQDLNMTDKCPACELSPLYQDLWHI